MQKYIIFIVIAAIIIIGAMMYKPAVQPAAVVTDQPPAAITQPVAPSGTVVTNPKPITMQNGLIIEDTKIGDGAEAKAGMTVAVHYVGTFKDGKKFDSSRDRGAPFEFTLGEGGVIKGWDEGVVGMKVGGIRKLTVPSDLAYGPNDYHQIPGGSTLYFEIELLAVQ